MPTDDLLDRLILDHYPRSQGYDPRWVVANQMGPNRVWLMESLTNGVTLEAGARVLDLGAGRADVDLPGQGVRNLGRGR